MSRFAITTGWKPWKPKQESRGGLARLLIRLVCAYAWRRHALARTATTSRSTTAPGMRAWPSKRRCRKPLRARVAVRCPRQPLSGNPVCQYYPVLPRRMARSTSGISRWDREWYFGPPVRRRVLCDVVGDHPGRHADGVPRSSRLCGQNAYRSGVSVCPLLLEPERGQLWVR